MLLYIMLYIVLAYLMLFAASTNVVCLNNASFFCQPLLGGQPSRTRRDIVLVTVLSTETRITLSF